ncbi:MAG: hypothetical protein CMJ34_00360 [Phycisphaerae bacterium]|nr:hypothetical protein [Phycisphaerae bacterium]
MSQIRFITVCTASVLLSVSTLNADDILDDIGHTDLVERLGAAAPTGAGVVVGQVEVPDPGYGPVQSDPEFAGINFIERSGAAGSSSHANTVATRYYGQTLSPAPGIGTVVLWDVNDFVTNGYLRVGQSTSPPSPPSGLKIFNHSWIGSFGSVGNDNNALRRADWAANTFRTLWIAGTNNGSTSSNQPLMSGMYHGISVGLVDGNHAFDDTSANLDGPGRMRPQLVAPGSATSWAAPLVGGCAALLLETAAVDPDLSGNSASTQPYVLKSVLLAGAVRDAAWTNNPSSAGADRGATSRPLDEVFGAGVLNIDRSHRIFTGLEQDGSAEVPAENTIDGPAWDFELLSSDEVLWHRFSLAEPAEEIGIALTWHRIVASNFSSSSVADADLELFTLDGNGSPVSLVGTGTQVFGSGNVRSESGVDNVEVLHVRDLAAGDYAVRIMRVDDVATSARAAIAFWIPETGDEPLVGDLNGDGQVDGADFGILLTAFGTNDPAADLDGSGEVGGGDIGVLLANWTG